MSNMRQHQATIAVDPRAAARTSPWTVDVEPADLLPIFQGAYDNAVDRAEDEVRELIAYTSTMRAHPGRRAELLECCASSSTRPRDEPGTLVYVMHEADDDADVVVSYELFADEARSRRTRRPPVVAAVMPRLDALVAEGSFRRLNPALATGLPDPAQ
jgi:quinol monooxygenase YgiN